MDFTDSRTLRLYKAAASVKAKNVQPASVSPFQPRFHTRLQKHQTHRDNLCCSLPYVHCTSARKTIDHSSQYRLAAECTVAGARHDGPFLVRLSQPTLPLDWRLVPLSTQSPSGKALSPAFVITAKASVDSDHDHPSFLPSLVNESSTLPSPLLLHSTRLSLPRTPLLPRA